MALSIVALAGIFVSMIRVVMVVLTVLAFAVLTWATGLLGDVVAGWMPAILGAIGAWGFYGGTAVIVVGGTVLLNRYQHRVEQRRYAATGIIEAEKPHPWPMWLRVLPFVLPALGMVAVIVAAANGN